MVYLFLLRGREVIKTWPKTALSLEYNCWAEWQKSARSSVWDILMAYPYQGMNTEAWPLLFPKPVPQISLQAWCLWVPTQSSNISPGWLLAELASADGNQNFIFFSLKKNHDRIYFCMFLSPHSQKQNLWYILQCLPLHPIIMTMLSWSVFRNATSSAWKDFSSISISNTRITAVLSLLCAPYLNLSYHIIIICLLVYFL